MGKILPWLIGGGLLIGGGIALAASSTPSVAQLSAKQRVLNALRSGDSATMNAQAQALQPTAPTEAAGLAKAGAFVGGLSTIAPDVAGTIVSTVRTVDPAQMLLLAPTLTTKGYAQQATDLATLAAFVQWVNGGGSQATSPKPAPNSPQDQSSTADIVLKAIQSGSPAEMRRVAAVLRASGHTVEADGLEASAAAIEAAQKVLPSVVPAAPATPASPAAPAAAPTPTQVATTVINNLPAAAQQLPQVLQDAAKNLPALNLPPMTIPGSLPAVVPPSVILPSVAASAVGKNAAMVPAVVSAVTKQAKGAAGQLATVKAFQGAEKLTRADGKYGSETALAIADRYSTVPPQPLYWGPDKGTYAQYLADKKDYKAHLQALQKSQPSMASQWGIAAGKVVLSGDEYEPDEAPEHVTNAKELAGKLALELRTAAKGSEPRSLVKLFQLNERLKTTDGSYNSETALCLAERFGIVPPKPLYWGKRGADIQTLIDDKNRYRLALARIESGDPQRADEWQLAAKV